MGVIFCDELTRTRQQLYWELFADYCTLEEWQWACIQAMDKETFHKVPLPAVLKDYVREYRRGRIQVPRGPGREQELLALREKLVSPDEISRLIASVWPEEEKGEPLYAP